VSRVDVAGLPGWVPLERLLGGEWAREPAADGTITATAERDPRDAADLAARLRGVGLGGRLLEVRVTPPLKRPWVRDARAADAKRRRETTPGFEKPGVRVDEEGRWSLTPEALALDLGRRAAKLGLATVVDAGCGVGGNTIGFARAGCSVVAVERDADRLELARHNAAIYGVSARVRFVRGAVEDVLPGLSADLLFLDPPWGPEWSRERTEAPQLPLLAAALAHRSQYREIWAKVPPSIDPATAPGALPEAWFGRAAGDRQRVKFVLLRWTSEEYPPGPGQERPDR
jgi:hypothetical protein